MSTKEPIGCFLKFNLPLLQNLFPKSLFFFFFLLPSFFKGSVFKKQKWMIPMFTNYNYKYIGN